jgi:competence protein ComEA
MGYRQKADVELARLITDRLALVLAEQPPRRARGPGSVTYEEPAQLLDEVSTTDGSLEPAALKAVTQHTDDVEEELPRLRFDRLHVGVIGALLVLGLITAGWLLLRARPVAVASPGELVTVATPVPTAASSTPSPAKSTSKIVIHVLGGVRHPGLVRLPESSRVQDAIDAAGGLTNQADPGELNLAQLLSDGQQVLIGTARHPAGEVREQPGSDSGPGGAGGGTGPAAKGALDLNRASQSQLEELPEVGPVTAQAILAWRQEHGRFTRIEELQEVDGIGPKTYAQLAPHVRV